MRILFLVPLATAHMFACSCIPAVSPCVAARDGKQVVFVGRVFVDSGPSPVGTRPARLLIEEPLTNVPDGLREVELDSGFGGTCHLRMTKDRRYVVFATWHRGRLSTSICSNTMWLEGNEHLLEALRNQARGGTARLIGMVRRSGGHGSPVTGIAGARITAYSTARQYDAVADESGWYVIDDIAPGTYEVRAQKNGFLALDQLDLPWPPPPSRDLEHRRLIPGEAPWDVNVTVGARRCEVFDLRMLLHGKISGTLVSAAIKEPLGGVTVQAYSISRNGKPVEKPIRTTRTDPDGGYLLEPLPEGRYIIAVNGEKERDADPYPPTFYTAGKQSAEPVSVTDTNEVRGIDIALPPKRTPATLRVEVKLADGSPCWGVTVTLFNSAGLERWHSAERTPRDGVIELPVYVGERYMVEARNDRYFSAKDNNYIHLLGKAPVDIKTKHETVVVTVAPRR